MSTFTLVGHFANFDGTPDTSTTKVVIRADVQILDVTAGIIFDSQTAAVADGVLSVDLPAPGAGVIPGMFTYTVSRSSGETRHWVVPGQPAGTTVNLADFTDPPSPPFDTYGGSY